MDLLFGSANVEVPEVSSRDGLSDVMTIELFFDYLFLSFEQSVA